jgi:SGNH hydrolase-like domain, acetyltransferase AlgX
VLVRAPTAVWLILAALYWALLALVARIPTAVAASVTDVLFVVALPFTYGAIIGGAVASSERPRSAALRAMAVTIGLLLALGLLELAAAGRIVHWELVFMSLRGEQQHYVPDPDLGFRHAPGARWSGRPRSDVEIALGLPASTSTPITITYDRGGYRNAAPLARADVILLGDSYVEGRYVSDDQLVSSFLQARLRRPVANLGVAGYGTAQELIVLKRDGFPLEPRIAIWFFFEGNDLYNDQEFENALLAPWEVRANAWTGQSGWWRRSLVRSAHGQLRLLAHAIVPRHWPHFGMLAVGHPRGQRVLFGPEAAVPWTDFERGRWERARDTLVEAARLTRERGIHLLLVYVPIKFRVYRDFVQLPPHSEAREWTLWPLPDLFTQLCGAERLACVDLTGALRDAVREGGTPYPSVDSHWSPEGHQLIASILEKELQSRGWLSAAGHRSPQ